MTTTVRADSANQRLPASATELAAVLREINAAGGHVRIAGADTGGGWLPPSAAGATTLSTRKLDRITEYDPADLTVTVEAGCTLGKLQETLGLGGQFLPVRYNAEGTIGGMVATAAWGRSSPGGAIRDRILGVSAVSAAGELTRCGSRVVKSVAGFDLAKLYCGSFGTLALITKVTFKVAPLPAARIDLRLGGGLEQALEFSTRILQSGSAPASIRLVRASIPGQLSTSERGDNEVDSGVGDLVCERLAALEGNHPMASSPPAGEGETGTFVVVLELAGRPAVVVRLESEWTELGSSLGLTRRENHIGDVDAHGIEDGDEVTVIEQPPSLLRSTLEALAFRSEVVADLASGRMVVSSLGDASLERVWQLVSSAGGSLRRRSGAGVEWRRARDPAAAALALRLKHALDPEDVLNRGLLEQLL